MNSRRPSSDYIVYVDQRRDVARQPILLANGGATFSAVLLLIECTVTVIPPALILSLSQPGAIRAGRHAMMAFERVGQGREVAETGGERNFGNRELTPPQGFSGPQQPALEQIAIGRPLRRSPKGADEVIGRQSGQGRKVGKTDFRGEIGLDIVEHDA